MKKVYVIAEAGVNHNGSVELAHKLIDAAKASRADAIKFQTFKTEKILTPSAEMANYQQKNMKMEGNQFQMLKELELSYEAFAVLKAYAKSVGLEFLSTPDDEESLDFLVDKLKLTCIKIGSGEVTNLPFLRRIAAKQKKIILSTGMSNLGEVERAFETLRQISKKEIVLLHCTSNYPCPPHEANLRAIQTLKNKFKTRVGYSDHTLGTEIPVAAVALGAEVIEKHLTLDKTMKGPDHVASLEPQEFAEMIYKIRFIEKALGNGVKVSSVSENEIKPMVQKRIVTARKLPAGIALKISDLHFKRAKSGIFVKNINGVIGLKLVKKLQANMPIEWNFLSK